MKNTPEHVTRWRNNQFAALESLATPEKLAELSRLKTRPGLAIWRALRRAEIGADAVSVRYCNGEASDAQWDDMKNRTLAAVARSLGELPKGFYLNSDPRGYALKLDPEAGAAIPEGMQKDWGGYGLLAPVIE